MSYTHGHHEAVLRSHTWRTAENSAAYLLPHLRPGLSLLDIGCGPGTITVDLARRVAPGPVIGIDAAPEVLEQARAHAAESGGSGVDFETGDVYALRFPDGTFDVVHAHQVLQHLTDPVAALSEMRRVVRPGGVVAARDGDYGAFTWAPADPMLARWVQLYLEVTEHNGHRARIGPSLLALAHAAGFEDVTVSSSTWTFADPDTRSWWGGLWADRVRYTRLAEQAVAYGLSTPEELEEIAQAFLRWANSPDAVYITPHVEILARR
ncbi:MAG TPA: methyltransferase domain-containing protein [Acidimicrobiales bacterium]|nr:methyltransferase domain-containing protein [Acidimicrobiales bacterium]